MKLRGPASVRYANRLFVIRMLCRPEFPFCSARTDEEPRSGLALTLAEVDDDDRRLLRLLAGLVADIIVTKDSYTDLFFQGRRSQPMSLAAEIQWTAAPRSMLIPQVALAGILEPAYNVRQF